MKTPGFMVRFFLAAVLAASVGSAASPALAQARPAPRPCTPASEIPGYKNIFDIPDVRIVGYDEFGRPIVTAPGPLVCMGRIIDDSQPQGTTPAQNTTGFFNIQPSRLRFQPTPARLQFNLPSSADLAKNLGFRVR